MSKEPYVVYKYIMYIVLKKDVEATCKSAITYNKQTLILNIENNKAKKILEIIKQELDNTLNIKNYGSYIHIKSKDEHVDNLTNDYIIQ